MARRDYEAPDLAAFLRRMARGMVRRAAEGDREILLALESAREDLELALVQAAQALHARGASWEEIGRELGISRQAAHKRFAPRSTDDEEARRP